MEGPSVALDLTGSASIPARELDLKGTASLLSIAAGGANIAVPAFELPFMVRGPWDDPIILPDPQSRIQRSGAAAPLIDAARDAARKSGSPALRSVIERLTGTAPPPPAVAPPSEEATHELAGTASAPAEGVPAAEETKPTAAAPTPQDAR